MTRNAPSVKAQQSSAKSTPKPTFGDWISGARLRTLPLAVAPVLIGAGAASLAEKFSLLLTALALGVALLLQIGVNFSNDYSDGVRGTDAFRVGPKRLTGSGTAAPKSVLKVALACFAAAAALGLVITIITQLWWFVAVGAVAIVAAWFYTGGKKPYGYAGLGEVVVFIFFGLVATMGTAFIQVKEFDPVATIGGIAAGCFATAVLLVNNIRDIETDRVAGKKTLATRIGRKASIALFIILLWLPFGLAALIWIFVPAVFFVNIGVFAALPISYILISARTPKELILVLKLTSYLALGFASLMCIGLFQVSA
jgi:1,4-dihydroxy-2-naphthoate octaprenyltransferase